MKKLIVATGLFVVLLGGLGTVVLAEQSDAWIHIRVHELNERGKNVSLNLPLAFAEAAAGIVPEKAMAKGLGKLQAKGVSLIDIRRAWSELRASGDAEFVSVEEEGKRTTVAREGRYIRVRVIDLATDAYRVRIDLPVTVVDASLKKEGEEIDLGAAVAQLSTERGDIVRVDDEEKRVRIWIDEQKQGS